MKFSAAKIFILRFVTTYLKNMNKTLNPGYILEQKSTGRILRVRAKSANSSSSAYRREKNGRGGKIGVTFIDPLLPELDGTHVEMKDLRVLATSYERYRFGDRLGYEWTGSKWART